MPSKQEHKDPDVFGWFMAGERPQDYFAQLDKEVYHSGTRSCRVWNTAPKASTWGTFMQQMSPDPYKGKRLRMTFWIKTDKISGMANGWLRVDGGEDNETLAFENMCNRSTKGTTDWTQHSIVLDVPEDSTNIAFGVIIGGRGTLWIDDFSFEEVDLSVPVTRCNCNTGRKDRPRNLNFEEE